MIYCLIFLLVSCEFKHLTTFFHYSRSFWGARILCDFSFFIFVLFCFFLLDLPQALILLKI